MLVGAHSPLIICFSCAQGYLKIASIDVLALRWLWSSRSNSHGAVKTRRQLVGVDVWTVQLALVAASNVTEYKSTDTAAQVRARVVPGFAKQVSKVDTFAEEASCAGCLRRSNAHALGQDADEV